MCIYLRGEREGERERVRKRANLDKLAPILQGDPLQFSLSNLVDLLAADLVCVWIHNAAQADYFLAQKAQCYRSGTNSGKIASREKKDGWGRT